MTGFEPAAKSVGQVPKRNWQLDLLRKWHTKSEGWILEQACIEQPHQVEAAPGLRVVGG